MKLWKHIFWKSSLFICSDILTEFHNNSNCNTWISSHNITKQGSRFKQRIPSSNLFKLSGQLHGHSMEIWKIEVTNCSKYVDIQLGVFVPLLSIYLSFVRLPQWQCFPHCDRVKWRSSVLHTYANIEIWQHEIHIKLLKYFFVSLHHNISEYELLE